MYVFVGNVWLRWVQLTSRLGCVGLITVNLMIQLGSPAFVGLCPSYLFRKEAAGWAYLLARR